MTLIKNYNTNTNSINSIPAITLKILNCFNYYSVQISDSDDLFHQQQNSK